MQYRLPRTTEQKLGKYPQPIKKCREGWGMLGNSWATSFLESISHKCCDTDLFLLGLTGALLRSNWQ